MNRLRYLKAFATSWHHAAMAAVTLAAPFATGEPLALIIGASAYVLGWVFIGDSAWFRRQIDAAENEKLAREEQAASAQLQAERTQLLSRLSPDAVRRYAALASVCRDIESQLTSGAGEFVPLEKLDGLMWSYLGLLGSEANLAEFISKEHGENFERRIAAAEEDLREAEASVAAVEPGTREYETRMQLIGSRQEGLEALRRRGQQFRRAEENLQLVRAEQERIVEQLKLLRADLYASKAVGHITERVSATIDQLASTGRLNAELPPPIKELPAFRTRRVGYDVQKE